MQEEKNYPPTKRKLKKEREKGNVWQSSEFASAIFFIFSGFFLVVIFSFTTFETIFKTIFLNLNQLTTESALKNAFMPILSKSVLFFVLVFIVSIFSYLVQRGWIWKKRPSNMGLFKKKKKRWLFPILKVIVFSGLAYVILRSIMIASPFYLMAPVVMWGAIFKKLFFLMAVLLLAYLLFGVFDLFYQRWLFLKKMRMSKKEMQDEKKEE